ncbi:MAG: RbsD/FucU domain-containing protein, partial [Clostridia bacterium]
MLKGISPLLSPELLKILAEMGHGDELVLGDCNFPAETMGKRCVRADGHKSAELVDAILQLLPLDTFVQAPVTLMQVPAGGLAADPPIWQDFERLVEKYQPGT